MWVSKRKWELINQKIENNEREICKLEMRINKKIQIMAKRILEQPKEMLEEINSITEIEEMVNSFIHH